MLIVYRIVYGLVAAVFLGNVIMASIEQPSACVSVLFGTAGVLLFGILGLLVGFSRFRPAVFWVLVLGWEALFVWYAWFSPATPFVLHEVHSFDANTVARESTTHYLKAGVLFALLFAWFLSLPFARIAWKGRAAGV